MFKSLKSKLIAGGFVLLIIAALVFFGVFKKNQAPVVPPKLTRTINTDSIRARRAEELKLLHSLNSRMDVVLERINVQDSILLALKKVRVANNDDVEDVELPGSIGESLLELEKLGY